MSYPLHDVILVGDVEQARRLIASPDTDVNLPDDTAWTPLHCAAETDRCEIARLLLQRGAALNPRDQKKGWTPLHYAALRCNTEFVRLLVDAGADIDACSKHESNTPLHLAATMGCAETVRALVDLGADREARAQGGLTPLAIAVTKDQLQCVKLLIALGADLHAGDVRDATPLHGAAYRGHEPIVDLLLAAGGRRDRVDGNGWTPADAALKGGHHLLAKRLAASQAPAAPPPQDEVPGHQRLLNNSLMLAVEQASVQRVKALLAAGVDVNCCFEPGWTPLMEATLKSPELVEMLLAAGANPNLATEAGYTPLQRAAGHGKSAIVQRLLAAGADPMMKDNRGQTAHDMARIEGYPETANLLAGRRDSAAPSRPSRNRASGDRAERYRFVFNSLPYSEDNLARVEKIVQQVGSAGYSCQRHESGGVEVVIALPSVMHFLTLEQAFRAAGLRG